MWVGLLLKEMKYLIFPFLRSGNEEKCGVPPLKVGNGSVSMGMKCLRSSWIVGSEIPFAYPFLPQPANSLGTLCYRLAIHIEIRAFGHTVRPIYRAVWAPLYTRKNIYFISSSGNRIHNCRVFSHTLCHYTITASTYIRWNSKILTPTLSKNLCISGSGVGAAAEIASFSFWKCPALTFGSVARNKTETYNTLLV